MVASGNGLVLVIEMLLKDKDVKVNHQDMEQKTCLHLAADRLKVIPLLLAAGADPTIKDFDWMTPSDVALQAGNLKCVDLLNVST